MKRGLKMTKNKDKLTEEVLKELERPIIFDGENKIFSYKGTVVEQAIKLTQQKTRAEIILLQDEIIKLRKKLEELKHETKTN